MESGARSEAWQRLWDQAGQSRDGSPTARMSLASTTGGGAGGAGDGDLRHSGGPWTKAAASAEALTTSMGIARSRLTSAHDGVAAGTAGLTSAATLRTVLTSWEERIGTVRDECDSLAPALRRVAKEQGEQDTAVKAAFGSVHAASAAKGR
ncbi:hypothetical protein [Streptomyces sp. NPDC126499]|uniref:hypothetical protein n=1 Tax=Streptomyces sp. NPDC126499 TaxID=3155314 RepID=UPI00332728ED